MLASFALLVIVTWKAVVQPVGMSSTLLPNVAEKTEFGVTVLLVCAM